MTQNHFDFIVVGAGGAGAATALELTRRKKRVLLLEQFSIAHDQGSSHGHSRIFRFAYDTPDYARMAVAARQAWTELEQESGLQLITPTGGLDIGPSDSASLNATAASLREIGATQQMLSAKELKARYPQWHVPTDWLGLYSQDAGIVNPTQTVELMVALAQAGGATVLERTPVTRIDTEKLLVHTSTQIFSADHIVVAAGAWLADLFPELKLPLNITEECTVYFKPHKPELFRPEKFPIFIEHNSLAYGFPSFGLPGIKIGFHHTGKTTTTNNRDFLPSQNYLEKLQAWLQAFLPDAAGKILQHKTCLYTNTPSQDFLLDTHPHNPRLVLASPCSGHGFKFAPLLGKMIGDMATGKTNENHLKRFTFAHMNSGASGPAI